MTDAQPCPKCGLPHPGCKSHSNRTGGKPCGRPPLRGQEVCRSHGGAAGQNKAAAKRRTEDQAARQVLRNLGEPAPDVDATQALMQLISWKYAEVVWLRDIVGGLDQGDLVWGVTEKSEKTGGEDWGTKKVEQAGAVVWWRLLREAENQLLAMTTGAIRSGLEERRVRVAESIGQAVVGMLRAVALDAAVRLTELGVGPEVLEAFHLAFNESARRHLLSLDGGQSLSGGN